MEPLPQTFVTSICRYNSTNSRRAASNFSTRMCFRLAKESIWAITSPCQCRAACTGPMLEPMANIVNRYPSATRPILGSANEAGPKYRVKLVRCSTLTRISSTPRCGIRRITSACRRGADSGIVRALYLGKTGSPFSLTGSPYSVGTDDPRELLILSVAAATRRQSLRQSGEAPPARKTPASGSHIPARTAILRGDLRRPQSRARTTLLLAVGRSDRTVRRSPTDGGPPTQDRGGAATTLATVCWRNPAARTSAAGTRRGDCSSRTTYAKRAMRNHPRWRG